MFDNINGAITSWFAKPFRGDGNAFEWFAFLGLIFIAAFIWRGIILEFQELID